MRRRVQDVAAPVPCLLIFLTLPDNPIQGVPGVESIHMGGGTSNLQAGEIFKIRGGKIHDIEAMGVSLPNGTKTGW